MIDLITNHEAQAKGRLLQQYKEAVNINSLLEVYAAQVQMLESCFGDLAILRMVEQAYGRQLDKLGSIVGERRDGQDDDVYRLFIFFKIGANRSGGTVEKIIELFRLIGGSGSVNVQNEGQGSIAIYYSTPDRPHFKDYLEDNMIKIIAAGVKVSGFVEFEPDVAFAFAGTFGEGLGFGDLHNPNVGGKFASVT